ncbi:MAG: hypothetical protein ACK53Y_00355 [bacterium]
MREHWSSHWAGCLNIVHYRIETYLCVARVSRTYRFALGTYLEPWLAPGIVRRYVRPLRRGSGRRRYRN